MKPAWQRICARDGIAPEMARRRLDAAAAAKMSVRAAADFVIENDGTLQQMQQRCNALLTALRKEAYGETSERKISANALCWHHPRRKWLFCGCVLVLLALLLAAITLLNRLAAIP